MPASDCPDFRVTLRRGRVQLLPWAPWMYRGGPFATLLAARGRAGVTFADLTVVHDGDTPAEIIVDFLGGDTPAAREALASWAAAVGYRRLWLPGEVVELTAGPLAGRATVVCASCRSRWTDARTDFWLGVRRAGHFPTVCPLCGGDLPQWTVCQDGLTRGDSLPDAKTRRPACT